MKKFKKKKRAHSSYTPSPDNSSYPNKAEVQKRRWFRLRRNSSAGQKKHESKSTLLDNGNHSHYVNNKKTTVADNKNSSTRLLFRRHQTVSDVQLTSHNGNTRGGDNVICPLPPAVTSANSAPHYKRTFLLRRDGDMDSEHRVLKRRQRLQVTRFIIFIII